MTEMNVTESSEKKSLNFIEQIVEKDLKEGKNGGRIQTRFPFHPWPRIYQSEARRNKTVTNICNKYL